MGIYARTWGGIIIDPFLVVQNNAVFQTVPAFSIVLIECYCISGREEGILEWQFVSRCLLDLPLQTTNRAYPQLHPFPSLRCPESSPPLDEET